MRETLGPNQRSPHHGSGTPHVPLLDIEQPNHRVFGVEFSSLLIGFCRAAFLVFGLLAGGLVWAVPAITEIVLGAEDDWPPYSSKKAEASGPEGFAVDLVREVFLQKGISVRFVALPFARCMFYAKSGRVAGCFNATIQNDIKDDYFWHRTPMFEEELAVFGPASFPSENLPLAYLRGKTVGYTIGYTYPAWFFEDSAIIKFGAKSDKVLLDMLAAHHLDFILLNTMPGYMRINSNAKLRGKIKKVGIISMDGFWVAFSKKHPDGERLSKLFEQGLQELKMSGKYTSMQSDFLRRLGINH